MSKKNQTKKIRASLLLRDAETGITRSITVTVDALDLEAALSIDTLRVIAKRLKETKAAPKKVERKAKPEVKKALRKFEPKSKIPQRPNPPKAPKAPKMKTVTLRQLEKEGEYIDQSIRSLKNSPREQLRELNRAHRHS